MLTIERFLHLHGNQSFGKKGFNRDNNKHGPSSVNISDLFQICNMQ